MKNLSILLILLVVVAFIPAMVHRNDHTAVVRGTFPDELSKGVDSHWVYLQGEDQVLDSTVVGAGRFELVTEIGSSHKTAVVTMPDFDLRQTVVLRPGHEIEIRISLEEYYRQRAERELLETQARLDEHGVSIPDSIWVQVRDALIENYLAKQK